MRSRALILALALIAAPSVLAVRVPTFDFEGTFVATKLGEEEKGEEGEAPRFALLTGEFTAEGTTTGLFTASGTHGARMVDVQRIESFRTNGKVPDQSSHPGLVASGGFRFFENVSVTISDNSTLAYFGGDLDGNALPQDYTSASAFAIVIPLDPPADLGGLGIDTAETSLAVIGPAALSVQPTNEGEAWLFFTQPNVNVTVWQGDRAVANLTGDEWVYRVQGVPRLSLEADSLLLPLAGNATARLRPADPSVAQERLDLTRVTEAFSQWMPNATGGGPEIDENTAQQIRQTAAIFNGVLFGNPPGNATVDERAQRELGDLTLYRFNELEVTPGEQRGEMDYEGSGAFVLAGSNLYSPKAATGSLPFPLLALFLWVFAIAAIVVGFTLKPFTVAGPANAARPVRLAALVFHLVMIPIAFILWDLETRAFLGTSILQVMGGPGGGGVAFAAVAGVQGLTFLLAWLFFGLPVRFIANSGLKIMQLKRARGIGKGLSYITAWGLGAAHYALLLNPFIGLLVGAFGNIQ